MKKMFAVLGMAMVILVGVIGVKAVWDNAADKKETEPLEQDLTEIMGEYMNDYHESIDYDHVEVTVIEDARFIMNAVTENGTPVASVCLVLNGGEYAEFYYAEYDRLG